MKFSSGLALAGFASLASAAAAEPAEVYVLSSTTSSSSSIPQIPRQVARHILFQKLGAEAQLNDLPETTTADEALSWIAQYGKAPKPLFGDDAASSPETVAPSQLLVVLEGVNKAQAKDLKKNLKAEPAFKIADVPSSKATKHLVDVELSGYAGSCQIGDAINPYDKCWNGMSLIVKYDLARDPAAIQNLIDNLPALRDAVSSKTLEATLVVLPESTRESSRADWTSPGSSELRRRAEAPLLDSKVVVPAAAEDDSSSLASGAFVADTPAQINLGCFTSFNSCVSATNNCTGHGACIDKYAASTSNGQSGDRQCFICACGITKSNPDKPDEDLHTHWGGAYCQKIDVSSPFWLLAGTTILLVGVVTGSIVLLFNVGEEKLPGVIGAGVSRSK